MTIQGMKKPVAKIYAQELKGALLKVTENNLRDDIAEAISVDFASNANYEDAALMHKGIYSIAKDISKRIKPEFLGK